MRNLLITMFLLLVVAGLLLLPSALQFRDSFGAVPPGVRLAGTNFGSADAATVATTLEAAFREPVAVYYAGQRLILRPQMVGFAIDVPAMLAEARQYGSAPRLALVFLGQLINRPPRPIEVPLHYTLNRDALDNWLSDVANRYDRAAVAPQAIVDRLMIQPGQSGWKLDLAESRDRVIGALNNPKARSADLVVQEAEPPRPHLAALEEMLRARLEQFPGTAGLFLHDTTTGEEIAINAELPYSALSTMKIPILVETYRKLDRSPDVEVRSLISNTMTMPGNQTANALLEFVGDGNAQAGVDRLNETLRTLGLKNTFMAAPFDEALPAEPHIVTEANSRPGVITRPDPYLQTTARDMGLMLEMLVECGQGGGALLAAFANQLKPDECQQALSYMLLNDTHELITQAIPDDTRMLHRQGYGEDTHADNAAIWGPAGPYVLSIYLQQSPKLDYYLSSQTMEDLSTAVWNYYMVVAEGQPKTP